MPDSSCGMQDLQLHHVGPSSLTRDRTRVPRTGITEVLTTGSPGKSPSPRRWHVLFPQKNVLLNFDSSFKMHYWCC